MKDNIYYGKHIQGIPFNPKYQDGILVTNPQGAEYPPQVRNREGKLEQYARWERKHFSGPIGRPKKYTDEELVQRKKEVARKAYLKRKAKQQQEK